MSDNKNVTIFAVFTKIKKNNTVFKKIANTSFFKSQFRYLKTYHSYHLVDPSPWPFVASLGAFSLTTGLVLYMHKFIGGWELFLTGFSMILYVMYTWWRDIIREATFEGHHTAVVQKGLRLGVLLFIVSEVMFFFAFFWGFFHSSFAPVFNIGGVWPPKAVVTMNTYSIPLTNTFFLLSSGATVTWAHHAVVVRAKKHALISLILTLVLAILFTGLQAFEYVNATFNISDSVYGSCFFLLTGFHGFHVFIGSIALFCAFVRTIFNHFTNKHHFGFEAAIWYWHFVDVVWLFLFISVYWWIDQNLVITVPLFQNWVPFSRVFDSVKWNFKDVIFQYFFVFINMLNILFYSFSTFLLLASLVIVFSSNSIVSVLFLILSFLISAILLLLLECEFLALLLITIYVGAVAVLFLFILMMLETKLTNLSKKLTLYFPFGVFISSIFFFEVLFCVSDSFETNSYSYFFSFLRVDYCNWYNKVDSLTDVEIFGQILYTHFVLQFLMIGFLLFLALVGVVYLSVNSTERKSKNQAVFHQLSRNPTVY